MGSMNKQKLQPNRRMIQKRLRKIKNKRQPPNLRNKENSSSVMSQVMKTWKPSELEVRLSTTNQMSSSIRIEKVNLEENKNYTLLIEGKPYPFIVEAGGIVAGASINGQIQDGQAI